MGTTDSKQNTHYEAFITKYELLHQKALTLKNDIKIKASNWAEKEGFTDKFDLLQHQNESFWYNLYHQLEQNRERLFNIIDLENQQVWLHSLQNEQRLLVDELANSFEKKLLMCDEEMVSLRFGVEKLEMRMNYSSKLCSQSKTIQKYSSAEPKQRSERRKLKQRLQIARLRKWLFHNSNTAGNCKNNLEQTENCQDITEKEESTIDKGSDNQLVPISWNDNL